MIVLFVLLFAVLTASLFGGLIYVLVEKLKAIRPLKQEPAEARERLEPAEQIQQDAKRIVQEAKERADAILRGGQEQEA